MKKRSIALVIETSNGYARGLLRGIHEFIVRHPGWSVYLSEHGRHEPDESFVRGWRGDGIIARIETARTAELVRALGVPVVDVSAARLVPDLPWVETDDRRIAEAALDHLFACGFRAVAYFGDPYYNWSRWREEAYRSVARSRGLAELVYNLPRRCDPQVSWFAERGAIVGWLESLPKPIGVFACYDGCAQHLLEICGYYDIQVPDEVAVVGVDDDELICRLTSPPLSSVIPDARRAGYLAAELLERVMAGEAVPSQKVEVPPLGVRRRRSTDVIAVNDPDVAKVLSVIRNHPTGRLTVHDLLTTVPVSRRVLESRFLKAIGRTPHDEILRVRTGRVKDMLAMTEMTLSEIAETLDVAHPEYVSVFFKKETGMTPSEFRARVRDPGYDGGR